MKYIIDVPIEEIEKIRMLINAGKYRNIQEFAQVSIENQLFMESSNEELLEPHGLKQLTEISNKPKEENKVQTQKKFLSRDIQGIPTSQTPSNKIRKSCLWGQYNRIFPIKVTLRTLANYIKYSGTNIDLESFQEDAANIAREIGKRLQTIDEKNNRYRDERFSTGFPIGSDEYKAKSRFKMHFVGYLTKDNIIEGAPGSLGFVDISRDENGKITIGLTKEGLDFALMENPVLDGENFGAILSDAEKKYYINHVFNNAKAEANAMILILGSIKKGVDNPDLLNEKIRVHNNSWSDAVINTMKVGLISRLFELNLIEKQRQGLHVKYSLTPEGELLVSRSE